jgi:hypothetical protein
MSDPRQVLHRLPRPASEVVLTWCMQVAQSVVRTDLLRRLHVQLTFTKIDSMKHAACNMVFVQIRKSCSAKATPEERDVQDAQNWAVDFCPPRTQYLQAI